MSSSKDYSERRRGDLANSVSTDTNLSKAERETSITFATDNERATVFTDQRSVMLSLLLYPPFEMEWYLTTNEDGDSTRRYVEDYEAEGHDGRKPVYGIKGTVPIGSLKIIKEPRNSNSQSGVVTSAVRREEPLEGEGDE